MKQYLLIIGYLILIAAFAFVYCKQIINLVKSIKGKNWKWLINTIIIILICTAILVFLIKPSSIIEGIKSCLVA